MPRKQKNEIAYTADGHGEVTGEKLRRNLFPTEPRIVQAAIKVLELPDEIITRGTTVLKKNNQPLQVLDAGAGETGIWGLTFKERFPNTVLSGIDIREIPQPDGYDHWYCESFLTHEKRYDIILGNIPFSLAEGFVRHGLPLLNPNGKLIFLLRAQFNGGQDRFRNFWTRFKLEREYYCVSRMPMIRKKNRKTGTFTLASDVWDYCMFQFSNEWKEDWWKTTRWDYKPASRLPPQPGLFELPEQTQAQQ